MSTQTIAHKFHEDEFNTNEKRNKWSRNPVCQFCGGTIWPCKIGIGFGYGG